MTRSGKIASTILFAAAAFSLIWTVVSLAINWYSYDPRTTSLPFHDIVLFRVMLWVPLALILVVVGWAIRRRAHRQGLPS